MSRPLSMRLSSHLATRQSSFLPKARLPALPLRTYATVKSAPQKPSLATKTPVQKDPTELDNLTTLSNGVRVASEALPGVFSGVGVYIDAGSRFESPSLRGVSHIMDRLAFKSTKNRSGDEMIETVESLGGNIQCASSRESMMYQAATFNSAVPTTFGLLAETIRDPTLTDDEIFDQLQTAAYEIREIWSKPDLILPELLHMAAFKDNTLGNPLLCPQDRLESINRNTIMKYRDYFYRPERIVVAFAGVDHNTAIKLTKQYFGDMKPSGELPLSNAARSPDTGSDVTSPLADGLPLSSGMPGGGSPTPSPVSHPFKYLSKMISKNISTSATHQANVIHPFAQTDIFAPSQYTGGFLSLPAQPVSQIPTQPNFTHLHIAFEGLPVASPDIYALATLQTLLGGGGSFSAGGPGKGMYSRLYTGVLNHHAWVENCVAFNHSYTDSGLFGISAACLPGRTAAMIDVICSQLRSLTLDTGYSALGIAEVNRAKNQLRSSLLMNLESRMVELEDLGRQIQVHGKKIPVKEMCQKIEDLTVKDLRIVATKVLQGLVENPGRGSGAPTVVLQEAMMPDGSVATLTWDQIQERISLWGLGKGA
ncbi:insulinase [Zalerion maritima]|uniref:Mitochondrial-processing peptidase subunit alpha n=1 Tax=Zalerion maritima TaxID=339359 RepID=A0AAD5WUG3_9PEZI|nr:insulinase [Zalerion maritima]